MKHSYLKSFFIATLAFPMLTFADEYAEKEHYPVAIRNPMAQTELEIQEGSQKFFSKRYPPVYFPSGAHCLSSISAFGDSLELEDGSTWKISHYDAKKVLSWGAQDPIIITQNHRWFSDFNYRIINQSTGSSLEANLQFGPIKNGPYTRYVTSLDFARGEVILSDQTRWQISDDGIYNFNNWMLLDAVIIGSNSGWDSSCEALLINVTMNESVTAQQF
jgi:hypothetical protein